MIVILDAFFLLLGICLGIYRINKCKKLMQNCNLIRFEDDSSLYDEVVLVIPIYNEQKVIHQSIKHFRPLIEKGVEVIYVGTKKEKGNIKTYEIAQKLIDEMGLEERCKVLVYPEDKGVMAHQLNYALSTLNDEKIVGIYNVDSVIDIKTIDYVLANREKLKKGVFQQYAYADIPTKGLIRNAVMWQNRWSLAYELPRTIDRREFGIKKFNYVIGHGLFFRQSLIREVGFFSEEQINEDNVLGYAFYINDVRIFPIPYLEKMGFAENIKVYIKQQSVWFNGPFYAFKYFKEMKGKRKATLERLWMAIQNYKNALNWFLFEHITLVSIIYLLFERRLLEVLGIILLILGYVSGINCMAEKILIKEKYFEKVERRGELYLICEIIFWLVIHTLGPIITFAKILTGSNSQKNKYKTEKSIL